MPQLIRSGSAKPKVLLVDDHRLLLDRVSAMLVDDFDVVGVATDGRQALDMASRLAPDAIVLDISMPGVDGFQTKRAMEQAGSRVPVVFLSSFDAEDYVSEAFRCGGRGYVLKLHLVRDLANALDQVLSGRLFAPSLTSLSELAERGGHAVQLHDGLEGSLDGVARLFDLALRRGDATCVISTDDVREDLGRRLRAMGWDLAGPSGHRRYIATDAAEALGRIMRNGLPDARLVGDVVLELEQYRRTVSEGPQSRLVLFGNMAELLITDRNPAAAIALEGQWHRLTRELPFFTVCGYHASCFHDSVPDVWSSACAEHWAVSHTSTRWSSRT
jgi:CheY-like chemotaxis protein